MKETLTRRKDEEVEHNGRDTGQKRQVRKSILVYNEAYNEKEEEEEENHKEIKN